MTPFDLRGPEFLVFYAAVAFVLMVVYLLWRRLSDHGGAPADLPVDPYVVAYLRGGRLEALRLALFTLLAEGAIEREGRLLNRVAEAPPRPLLPMEAEVWAELEGWRTLDSLFRDGVGLSAGDALEARLQELGYRRTESETNRDHVISMLLGGLLALVGTVKIVIAISRGHHNVMFLLMFIFIFAAISFRMPSALTSRGERALAGVQGLLQGLKGRALGDTTPAPAELAMVMAAFGLLAFRHGDYPFLVALGGGRFQLASAGVGGGGSSCNSTFTSSCGGGGSSCGSSCGGGCGGGGCGGCGS